MLVFNLKYTNQSYIHYRGATCGGGCSTPSPPRGWGLPLGSAPTQGGEVPYLGDGGVDLDL